MNWLSLLLFVSYVLSIAPIEVKGNGFFDSVTHKRFYIRGLDYQPGGSSNLKDPISDPDTCERDIPYFQKLGVNTIRIYSIDNTKDHKECMNKLADAGIYVLFDVNTPSASITRGNDSDCSYNTMYLNEVFASMLKVANYDNTLGFFAANEVINDQASTAAATNVKAVVRDMKHFLKNRGLRQIPVGYSAADVEENRLNTAEFFNCGDDDMARVDTLGFNDYSWCGDSSYTTSGYDQKVKSFSDYSIPLFFSEYGCNKVSPRQFTEIEAIYSEDMTGVFSGGLVYEYSEESNEYGLVNLDGDDVKTNDDFNNLQSMFAKVENPSGDGGYQADLEHSECPSKSSNWQASNDIPDTPKGALKYIIADAEPSGNGFNASTQWACVAGGNDEDDSGNYSSIASSMPTSGGRSGSSSSGSSDDDDDGHHRRSSSGLASSVNGVGWLPMVAIAIGVFVF
ncbi:1,3-beta-glucanosyltransferase [Yamadazyma tenuis]|uniref:1,3-beta-glucanosyltransferase n=1 Tax=Candida tenuis (strain ATCC 10573 / BCRC 21748 / CBS 615 / JCM 9827 / NBRC 10315 / NRRL Y-1498 / VKM Y-70) TaxID=590646 RepID=G3B4Z4_CANTC|nr:uncharacterized protein CANTEDRAFT_114059 [Yamadazyma tenuis ATCC 10573]XP_006686644.1 uncharacterized protein CANTEDRAFT_114059 [Yamadazyma tenuis ATCC 10573]EGV64329.1 hypothetical protein CANTEDRAFT_114059 [Yamadazyma tenuis ATCC 10573]EGV64330.1 hypothetical protein CANTEDRAFT_114059 [Yamadazyma tenuis ATCC 10573]WEJ96357.1 1,3-beta-glucanosyltransferase [Yamadazyma tenuis]